jgi:hypothetical protein
MCVVIYSYFHEGWTPRREAVALGIWDDRHALDSGRLCTEESERGRRPRGNDDGVESNAPYDYRARVELDEASRSVLSCCAEDAAKEAIRGRRSRNRAAQEEAGRREGRLEGDVGDGVIQDRDSYREKLLLIGKS